MYLVDKFPYGTKSKSMHFYINIFILIFKDKYFAYTCIDKSRVHAFPPIKSKL